jgi:hypothetical protein
VKSKYILSLFLIRTELENGDQSYSEGDQKRGKPGSRGNFFSKEKRGSTGYQERADTFEGEEPV